MFDQLQTDVHSKHAAPDTTHRPQVIPIDDAAKRLLPFDFPVQS